MREKRELFFCSFAKEGASPSSIHAATTMHCKLNRALAQQLFHKLNSRSVGCHTLSCACCILADFEKTEEKRLEQEMSAYAQELEEETKREKEKHDRNIEALNKRKEELLEENKRKLQVL